MRRRERNVHKGQRVVFPLVHSKKRGKFKGTDLPDNEGTEGNESRFVRCQWCKTINIINGRQKRPKGDGWGGNIEYRDSGATVTTLKYEVVQGAGCWFCGSSNFYEGE